jgi:hypothetical protein
VYKKQSGRLNGVVAASIRKKLTSAEPDWPILLTAVS